MILTTKQGSTFKIDRVRTHVGLIAARLESAKGWVRENGKDDEYYFVILDEEHIRGVYFSRIEYTHDAEQNRNFARLNEYAKNRIR